MMQGMLNAMRLQAMMQGQSRIATRLGTILGYDSANYCAKVMIQPENIESGWLPIASPWVGNGWGIFAPPADGDVVIITFQEEDFSAGIITQRLFTDSARPLNVPVGEFWLVHQSGSLLKFHNDGSVELTSNKNLTVTVGGDMNATVTGALTATVTGKATISGSEVDLLGGSSTAPVNGIVQGDCICAFTGSKHMMTSAKVKGSM